ncbi:MAG: class I SAM-dependent RNA methyltransferase [Planctomycetes bacterium]|nr:class I SAM-dependent RNA methyltransferase [Planctomycetota bacterium]
MTNDIQHCSHFGRCGGCSLLDVPIAEQLAQKQAAARELLAAALAGVEPEISLPPRPPRYDRTAILYPVQPRRRGLALGIYRRGTHQVEPIQDCRIQHRALTTFGTLAGEVLRHHRVSAYDERTGDGIVRAIRARVMPGSNELLVGVVTTTSKFAHRDALVADLADAGRQLRDDQGRKLKLVGAVLNVNDQPGNALIGPTTTALHGRAWQQDRVGELKIRVSFESFYQLHRHADAVLFRPALEVLGDVRGKRVVDGYGGVGTFALRLLRDGAAHVTLIESSPSACGDARVNFEQNGFNGGEVREQPFGAEPLPACDVLLVDPPRAGLQEQGAAAVAASEAAQVLLVSCSLESLGRDLERLMPSHRVVRLRLCDLFPHTDHVEAVTLLARR